MSDISLDFIKNYYTELPDDSNEATISQKIVINFLIHLGYEEKWITPQKIIDPECTCDLFIESPTGNKLIVEVKSKNHKLNEKDKRQNNRYLNGDAVEWGILTNGNEYLLINHTLSDLKPTEKCCLRYDLICENFHITSKSMNNFFLNFFTYDYLFTKKATKFFSEFQHFKVKSLGNSSISSIKQYKSANYAFLKFLTYDSDDLFDFDDLTFKNLVKHFKILLNNKNLSQKTIINKYRYIKSFVDFLEKNNVLKNKNTFTLINEIDITNQLNLTINEKDITPITLDEIKLLLNHQSKESKTGLRNIIVTQLICYLALSRESIINLIISDISKNNDGIYVLNITNMNIKLPESMTKTIDEYLQQRKKDNIKFSNLFYSQYTMNNKKFKKMTVSTINQIINDAYNKIIAIPEERRMELNYSLLRNSVIKRLYEKFSLEEISYFTGLTIDSIYKSLSDSKSLSTKISRIPNKLFTNHPYNNILF